ncbi:MAG: hypothetical protein Hals2KO_02360 [Halioglobus sp.]
MTAALTHDEQRAIADAVAKQLAKRIQRGEFNHLSPLAPGDDRIVKLADCEEISGLSSSEIYRLMSKGLFPRNVQLAGKSRGWKMSDLQHWIRSRDVAA